ncbi:MAG: hypothetical protein AAF236_12065, partial [Verrucomicrobiota bacterium]
KGNYLSARISDFKTDQISGSDEYSKLEEIYGPQLDTYRVVLHRITRIPVDEIETELILVRSGEVLKVGR